MHQAILTRQDVDEGAKVHELGNAALVDHPHFHIGGDLLDTAQCLLAGGVVHRRNLDRAVVGNIDGGTGFLGDRANGGTALADNVTDLVGVNLDADDAGRVFRHLGTGLADGFCHLIEDVQPALVGLIQRLLHDLPGDPVDLDIHLQCRDAFAGARNLEVHVAQMILVTHDVREHDVLVAFLDEPHRDAGDRPLDGHTGIHQRHARAADACHGARAVRFGNFRHHAYHVGKLFGEIRHHRDDAALCQSAMTDFAPLGRSHPPGLADAEGWKIVVHHERLAPFALDGIDDLCVAAGTEGGDHDGLRLTACEQGRTVGPGQHTDPGRNSAHRIGVTTVDALFAGENPTAHDALLEPRECPDHLVRFPLAVVTPRQLLDCLVSNLEHAPLALELVGDPVGFAERVGGVRGNALGEHRVILVRLPIPGGLAHFFLELANEANHRLHLIVTIEHGVQHHAFG